MLSFLQYTAKSFKTNQILGFKRKDGFKVRAYCHTLKKLIFYSVDLHLTKTDIFYQSVRLQRLCAK